MTFLCLSRQNTYWKKKVKFYFIHPHTGSIYNNNVMEKKCDSLLNCTASSCKTNKPLTKIFCQYLIIAVGPLQEIIFTIACGVTGWGIVILFFLLGAYKWMDTCGSHAVQCKRPFLCPLTGMGTDFEKKKTNILCDDTADFTSPQPT